MNMQGGKKTYHRLAWWLGINNQSLDRRSLQVLQVSKKFFKIVIISLIDLMAIT